MLHQKAVFIPISSCFLAVFGIFYESVCRYIAFNDFFRSLFTISAASLYPSNAELPGAWHRFPAGAPAFLS